PRASTASPASRASGRAVNPPHHTASANGSSPPAASTARPGSTAATRACSATVTPSRASALRKWARPASLRPCPSSPAVASVTRLDVAGVEVDPGGGGLDERHAPAGELRQARRGDRLARGDLMQAQALDERAGGVHEGHAGALAGAVGDPDRGERTRVAPA